VLTVDDDIFRREALDYHSRQPMMCMPASNIPERPGWTAVVFLAAVSISIAVLAGVSMPLYMALPARVERQPNDRLTVTAFVSEQQARRLRVGDPVLVDVSETSGHSATSRIDQIKSSAGTTRTDARSVRVEASLNASHIPALDQALASGTAVVFVRTGSESLLLHLLPGHGSRRATTP
jgi:hypothetical protein